MAKDKKTKIVIEGITEEGTIFRPSDWAERVSGHLSTIKNQRLHYSPLLKPSFKDGKRCLIIDRELQTLHPALYQHILDFAKHNKLRICSDENSGEKHEK